VFGESANANRFIPADTTRLEPLFADDIRSPGKFGIDEWLGQG